MKIFTSTHLTMIIVVVSFIAITTSWFYYAKETPDKKPITSFREAYYACVVHEAGLYEGKGSIGKCDAIKNVDVIPQN